MRALLDGARGIGTVSVLVSRLVSMFEHMVSIILFQTYVSLRLLSYVVKHRARLMQEGLVAGPANWQLATPSSLACCF